MLSDATVLDVFHPALFPLRIPAPAIVMNVVAFGADDQTIHVANVARGHAGAALKRELRSLAIFGELAEHERRLIARLAVMRQLELSAVEVIERGHSLTRLAD